MGTYTRAKFRRKRSVSDALREAEEDHFLDCPDAPFLIRSAAFFLDMIFLFLIASALNRLCFTALAYLNLQGDTPAEARAWLASLQVALTAVVFYHYQIWSVMRFAGSPAKLLLGMKILEASSGHKLTFRQVLVRELIGKALGVLSGGIGFLLPLFRKDSRTLHDILAGSVVKKILGDP